MDRLNNTRYNWIAKIQTRNEQINVRGRRTKWDYWCCCAGPSTHEPALKMKSMGGINTFSFAAFE